MSKNRKIEKPPDWLSSGGEMGKVISQIDWSKTPVGPISAWSPTLKMMVRFLLANRFPMLLWWGPEFCQIYNDAYRPVLGTKHPKSMGQPLKECWHEIWHIIGPLAETPFHGGPSTWMEDIALEINRHGYTEETHFTIAYSPVPDETVMSGIGGVVATVHEISEKVVGERRILALRDLGIREETKTVEELCTSAARTLAKFPKDIPFALIYLIDSEERTAHLTGTAGIVEGRAISPLVIELKSGEDSGSQPWNLAETLRTEKIDVVDNIAERFPNEVPSGPWPDRPRQAVIAPIHSNVAHHPAGFVIFGLSPYLRFDASYQTFIELATSQIATAIANARVYEEEKRRADALAELDRAKTAFFSNVSHEFRTPLTLMLGPIEDALSDQELVTKTKERLEVAHRNSLRLLKLVNALLDFSRLEAGRIQAVYEPVDLSKLTADLASVFRSAIERAGMKLFIDCPPLPEAIYVDREMWEKIVLNLISNAFKFTFEGEISVSLRPVKKAVELVVKDTGTGIPAKELQNIFERFHRVEGAQSRSYEGSGIGLALVQELVKLHGGSVRVESEPGHGATFTILIPTGYLHLPAERIGGIRSLASTATGAPSFVEEAMHWLPSLRAINEPKKVLLENSTEASASPPSARILLADDNADMREYVSHLLSEYYEVVAVEDGQAALEAARENPPDLILTDVMMPKLDGFGLLKALREKELTRTIPVIMLSARAGEEAKVQGMEAGADDYLIKPFSARELLTRVKAHLEMTRIRRKSEFAIRASEERMRLAITAGGMATWDADLRTGKAFWSENHFRILGYETNPEGEATFEMWKTRIHPDDYDRVIQVIEEAKRNNAIFQSEHRMIRADDGRIIWISASGSFQYEPTGEAVRFIGVFFDITERKQHEVRVSLLAEIGELSESLTDVDSLLFAVAKAIGERLHVSRCLFNETDVDQDREIVHNDYFQGVPSVAGIHKLSDYSQVTSDEMKAGKTVVNHDSKIDPRTAKDFARSYERNRERAYVAVPLFRENNWVATLWVSNKEPREWSKEEVSLLEEIGARIWTTVEKMRSETVRKQLEWINSQLLQQERAARISAEEASHLKDLFLATVSHELRTPLNAILGWAHMLQSNPVDTKMESSAINAIYASAKNQAQIIDDLLDVARIVGGKMSLQPEMLKVSEVLSASLNIVTHATKAKNIRVDIQFENGAEYATLYADSQRLQQIFWNILSNAVKFTPNGGSIEIRTRQTSTEAVIVFRDSGIGISREFLPAVFERFLQADSTTTRKFGGIGLGLSIAKHLVELHGGTISADSEGEGKGSTFTVRLPVTYAQADQSALPQGSISTDQFSYDIRLTGKRILVVDDDYESLHLMREVFQRALAEVHVSDSAKEGLEIFKESLPDLLISDIAMPDYDGYWLIRRVRSLRQGGQNVPAIGLTAYASVGDRTKVLHSGFQMFVPKPLIPAELLKVAQDLLKPLVAKNTEFLNGRSRPSDARPTIPNLVGRKVLLVEDDLLSTEVFRLAMEQQGLIFRSATKASQALEILADWLPDIIVSDLGLPDEDGYSLIRKIRSIPAIKKANIPAVALTGYGKDDEARALTAGFQAYKSKPIDADALVSILNDLIQEKRSSRRTETEKAL